jgi:hypothetical protein
MATPMEQVRPCTRPDSRDSTHAIDFLIYSDPRPILRASHAVQSGSILSFTFLIFTR